MVACERCGDTAGAFEQVLLCAAWFFSKGAAGWTLRRTEDDSGVMERYLCPACSLSRREVTGPHER
jgi:hypothetical protein